MWKYMAFYWLQEHLVTNIIDTATKTGIDVSKTASKKVVHETAEATGGLTGNKTADRYTSVIVENSKMKYLFKKYTYH